MAFIRPYFFQYFSRPIISFSAILPRISNFRIRKDIRLGVRAASNICKYSQVLASRSHAFSMHSQENVKKNRNPFALFVMDSQKFTRIRKDFASIHKTSLFSVFLQTNFIIFGEFAANFRFSYSQGYSSQCERGISHHRTKQVLNKFRIKWCLSSYFSLPTKLLLIQSGIFAPIRAPPGRFDNIIIEIMVLITLATSEGSGEPAHPCSLDRAFAVRTHEVWKKTKGQTKNQISSLTVWQRMRV